MFTSIVRRLNKLITGSKKHNDRADSISPAGIPLPPEHRIPVFAIGCGRSGTHFIARLMENDTRIASYHADTVDAANADSFLRYCTWNNLPVDLEGFLRHRNRLVDGSAALGRVYFEANTYLSLNLLTLFDRFHAKFVYLVRRPEDTVNSHYVKRWYEETVAKSDLGLSLGYQYDVKSPHHFFGRIVPNGREFQRWQSLTRIGKIAWMWNVLNMAILRQLEKLPYKQYVVQKLEDVDHVRYLEIHSFIGGSFPLSEEKFEEIRRVKPGKGRTHRLANTWSELEREEFLFETKQARDLLGY